MTIKLNDQESIYLVVLASCGNSDKARLVAGMDIYDEAMLLSRIMKNPK